MPYITSVEKIGFERGVKRVKQEGRQEGRQAVARNNLLRQGIAIDVITQATGLSAEVLQQVQVDLQVHQVNGVFSD